MRESASIEVLPGAARAVRPGDLKDKRVLF